MMEVRLVRSREFEEIVDSVITWAVACCSVISLGFRRVQLREVIGILHGFDLGGCSMFHCAPPERKVDVRVVLMLLRKPRLRPGFSKIDDNTIVPFPHRLMWFIFFYLAVSSHTKTVL